jgi:hypothetical protein
MKKTPRDLLLSRHAAEVPQLDQLRRKTLDDATPVPARQVFHALFFPQRRLWLGLAAAWIAILALDFTQRPATRQNNAKAAALYASNWSTNQAQLHALLTETRSYH